MKHSKEELLQITGKAMKQRQSEHHRVRIVLSKKKEAPSKKVDWKAELEKDKN